MYSVFDRQPCLFLQEETESGFVAFSGTGEQLRIKKKKKKKT